MITQTTEHEPTLLTPQELLLSRLPGLLSFWAHERNGGAGAYGTAQDLVAIWSGLQRLALPHPPSDILRRVDEILHNDIALFLEALLSYDFDDNAWQREMEKLDSDWDSGREEADELEWRTRQAFDALDRAELFAWFATTKGATDPRIKAWFEPLPGKYERAERFIADRPDLFLCLATDLAAVIASSRAGLEDSDPLLWQSLGKHRRIEEARDEIELAPSPRMVLAGVARKTPALSGEMLPADAMFSIGKAVTKPAAGDP